MPVRTVEVSSHILPSLSPLNVSDRYDHAPQDRRVGVRISIQARTNHEPQV